MSYIRSWERAFRLNPSLKIRYLIHEFGSEAICLTYHFFSLPAKNTILYKARKQFVLKDAKYSSCVDF